MIGATGFGGPAGQVAILHREVVERRKWLEEEEFLAAMRLCMLLPGPEAQQLATYAGWRQGGVAGGLLAGTLFVIPGALLVTALAWLRAAGEHPPLAGGRRDRDRSPRGTGLGRQLSARGPGGGHRGPIVMAAVSAVALLRGWASTPVVVAAAASVGGLLQAVA
jgi:chromate transporter